MIHLIHGDQEFLRAEALAELKASLGAREFVELNTTELDGARLTLPALHDACDAVPFLAPRRLVIVRGLVAALGRKSQRPRATEQAVASDEAAPDSALLAGLLAYLPQLPDFTDLVFVETSLVRKQDALHKLIEQLATSGQARTLVCQYEGPWWKQDEWLRDWTARRARQHKMKIEPAAAQALTDLIGDNLRLLDQELGKLQTYAGPGQTIQVADVRRLVSAVRETSVFAMVEALAAGDGQQAVRLLHELLQAGEAPLSILGMIGWQYRLLLQVNDLAAQGMSQDEVASALKQKPYTIKKAWPSAQRYSLAALEQAMERLLASDVAIKTGQMEDRVALDVLVAELSMRNKR
jgi:DNA polymerase-3 subunit delta